MRRRLPPPEALRQGIHSVHVLKHNGIDERMTLDAADVRTHAAAERGKVAADIARAQYQHVGVFLSEVTGPKSSQRCSRCKS